MTTEQRNAELVRLRAALVKQNEDICQDLGKALGYPWYKDDQVNFPDATEANGVCIGDHVAESIAAEAARKIRDQDIEIAKLRDLTEKLIKACQYAAGSFGQVSADQTVPPIVLHDCKDRLDDAWQKAVKVLEESKP